MCTGISESGNATRMQAQWHGPHFHKERGASCFASCMIGCDGFFPRDASILADAGHLYGAAVFIFPQILLLRDVQFAVHIYNLVRRVSLIPATTVARGCSISFSHAAYPTLRSRDSSNDVTHVFATLMFRRISAVAVKQIACQHRLKHCLGPTATYTPRKAPKISFCRLS